MNCISKPRSTTAGTAGHTARQASDHGGATSSARLRRPAAGPRGRGRKARRGDIRTAALLLLAEEPRNGYQIMQEVEERSDGVWRPSPGSVYPALAQLEDEGLIRSEESDGRKLFAITDAGPQARRGARQRRPAPWEQMSDGLGAQAQELGKLMREVASAFVQVMRTGSEAQMAARPRGADTSTRATSTGSSPTATSEGGDATVGGDS